MISEIDSINPNFQDKNENSKTSDLSINRLFRASVNPFTGRNIFRRRGKVGTWKGSIEKSEGEESKKKEKEISQSKVRSQGINPHVQKSNLLIYDWIMRRHKFKLKIIDSVIFFFICVNAVLSICDTNYTPTALDNDADAMSTDTVTSTTLRWTCVSVVVVMEILLIIRYYIHLKVLRTMNLAGEKDTLISTGLAKRLAVEFFILALFSPPNVDYALSGTMLDGFYVYPYNTLINCFIMLKFYYFFRIYEHFSPFVNENASRIAKNFNQRIDITFAIKCQLKTHPYYSLIFLFSLALIIFGFVLRTFEYGFTHLDTEKEQEFKQYTESFWLIVITMMTVGYGDLYPRTHFGRVICFFACVMGMFIISWSIVSLSAVIECKPEENKALCVFKIEEVQGELKTNAINVVQFVCRFYLFKSKAQPKIIRSKKGGIHNTIKGLSFHNSKILSKKCIDNQQIEPQVVDKNYSQHILNFYFAHLPNLRKYLLCFKRSLQLFQTISLPTDDLLKKLKDKLSEDAQVFNKYKSTLHTISDFSNRISIEEIEINSKLKHITSIQVKLAEFLVELNNSAKKTKS